jgi:hypothetical protein
VGVGVVAFTPCAAEFLQLLNAYPSSASMPHRVLNEGVAKSALRIFIAHPGVSIIMALFEAFLLALYGLAIRGYLTADRRNPAVITLVGIAIYFVLISGGAQAVGRYRAPVMPLLCVLAAGGLSPCGQRKLRSHDSSAVETCTVS